MATKKKTAPRKRARALDTAKPPAVTEKANGEVKEPKVPPVESMAVPVALLLAAESIAAKADQERKDLQAVMFHQKDNGIGRIVGYDGRRLFVGSFALPAKAPSWMKTGLMLSRDGLKARVAMIAKDDNKAVVISHAKGNAAAFLADAASADERSIAFRVPCAEVMSFPNYEAVFALGSFADMSEDGELAQKREWEPVGFNSRHLRHCGEIAKILEASMEKDKREENGMTIRAYDNGDSTAPRVFDFVGWPGAVLAIEAVQLTQTVLPLATARILAPAVKLTVAALRAHATRWLDAAEKADSETAKAACIQKAQGFQVRVADVLARADMAPPAVGTDAKPDAPAEDADDKPVQPPAPVTKAEKAAATRKRRAAAAGGATVH